MKKNMKIRGKDILYFLFDFIQILIIIYVIVVTCFILCKNKFGYTQFGKYVFMTVHDNNYGYHDKMELGSLLAIKENDVVKEGNIVYYYSVVNEQYIIKTDIVEKVIVNDENSKEYILVDENVDSEKIIGTQASSCQNIGKFVDLLERKNGFLVFVLLPIVLVFIYQFYEFVVMMLIGKDKKIEMEKEIEKVNAINEMLEDVEVLDLFKEEKDDVDVL